MYTSESTLIAGIDAAHQELVHALVELRAQFEAGGPHLRAAPARHVAFAAGRLLDLARGLVLLCVAAPMGAQDAAAILDIHCE
jgi:hypothetical protein